MSRAKPATFALVALVLLVSGCGDPSVDSEDPNAEVRSICDQDRDVFERCGYTKFETRAECERAFGESNDADRAMAHEYYDCLTTCTGPGPEFNALEEQCLSIVGGGDGDRAPCEMLCNKLAAAACSAGPSVDYCLPNCFRTYGVCPAEMTALAMCAQTFTCTPDGTPYPTGCDAENAAVSSCYNSMP